MSFSKILFLSSLNIFFSIVNRIPTPQPVISRPMFGANPSTLGTSCISFVSGASVETVRSTYGLVKRIEAVRNCRSVGKADMKLNNSLPSIDVDPETYEVKVHGKVIKIEPATTVCMCQQFLLF